MESSNEGTPITLDNEKVIHMAMLAIETSRIADERSSDAKTRKYDDRLRKIAPDEVHELGPAASKGLLMALSRVRSGEIPANSDVLSWAIYMTDQHGVRPRTSNS